MSSTPPHILAEVGSPAPDFELVATGNTRVRLSEFRGKRHVVLVFYPLDWSPVCSNQLPALQADLARFHALGAEVLGISVDSRWSHEAFAQQLGVTFPLLADIHREACIAYGLFREKANHSRRAILLVDRGGKIIHRKVFEPGEIPSHEDVFRVLESLA